MNVLGRFLAFGRVKRSGSSPGRASGPDRTPAARLRHECRFETAEARRMLDGDPIDVGIVYVEQDLGGDDHGDKFEITFEGGADGTQLTEIVIDGDQNANGIVDKGDMFFDVAAGGLGADHFHAFQVVSNSGIGSVTAQVVDGGTKLVLKFTGFEAGDRLVFSIDVDEMDKDYGGSLENRNRGVDPIASGVEFEGTKFQTTFTAPGYYNSVGTSTFQNFYDPQLVQSGLSLPADNFEGKRDRSDAAFDHLVQEALPIQISGTVWHDRDHDVRQDPGEEGIAGATLTLQKWNDASGQWENIASNGKSVTTTRTDVNGDYKFGYDLDLKPGRYRIIETQPAGYEISTGAAPGTVSGATSGKVVAGNPNVLTDIVITTGGTQSIDNDFGEAKLANVSGHVYHDLDNDGIRDAGEAPIAGVMIRIIPVDTVTPQSEVVVYTDANGYYEATGLAPGTYRIVETQPNGWADGKEAVGTVGGVKSGSLDGNDRFKGIVLTSGSSGVNYDFGELKPAEIHGQVHYADRDGNCFNENVYHAPIAGVLIELFDGSGALVAQTRTDANGNYAFLNLAPGTYSVVEHTPNGLIDGGERVGSIDGKAVGTKTDDRISNITLASGDVGLHYDFCEKAPAKLSGHVYVDNDLSRSLTATDKLLVGVKVELFDQSGKLVAQTTTDANGYYEFLGLEKGIYTVVESQPQGYLDWYDQAGTINGAVVGAAVNPGDRIHTIDLGFGESSVQNNFGEVPPSSIEGRVHADRGGDCAYEPEEGDILLAGVKIELLDASGNVIATTFTDAEGRYRFDDIYPGQYQVREIQPVGYLHGGQDVGSLGGVESKDLISQIQVGVGQQGTGYDFCERFPASIDGNVWLDLDRDCEWDAGEPAIGNVRIDLYDASGNLVATTYTDSLGYYKFSNLAPGTYTLIETQPDGLLQGCHSAGSHGGDDSVEDVITQITLGYGDDAVHYDFAERIRDFTPEPPPEPEPPTPRPLAQALPREEVSLQNPQLPPAPPTIDPYIPVDPYTWHLSLVDAGDPRGQDGGPDTVFSNVSLRGDDAWTTRRVNLGRWTLLSGDDPAAAVAAGRQILFGVEQGIPVVGDFDGDGKDEIGVFANGQWFLDLDGDGQWSSTDLYAELGQEGDLPVVGDWDGDGKDDIGIYGPIWHGDTEALRVEPGLPDAENLLATERAKNVPPTPDEATSGRRTLQATEGGRIRTDLIDHVFAFGGKGEVPLTGDWNGDGISSIGSFVDGKWTLDSDGDGRLTERDGIHQFGQPGDLPVVGDWNGDGVPQLGVYRGGEWILDTNGNREIDAVDRVFQSGGPDELPVVGDWNGDGTDEVGTYRPDSIRTASVDRDAA